MPDRDTEPALHVLQLPCLDDVFPYGICIPQSVVGIVADYSGRSIHVFKSNLSLKSVKQSIFGQHCMLAAPFITIRLPESV
jgi:hypothetical protein